jgi:hypothetical protein
MTAVSERFAVIVRGDVRCRFSDAWVAEREAARLRSLGWPAHAVDQVAERQRAAKSARRWP